MIKKIRFNDISLLVLLLCILLVVLIVTPLKLIDDTYISFRYAHNLANNGQLVFNLGERVEGITNLLWTLILAAQTTIFNIPIELFVLPLSIFMLGFTCFRLWQLGPLLGSTYLVSTIAGLLLILNPNFIKSTTNGLEAALYIALQAEIIYRYSRKQLKLAFFSAGLLFMTRPEGLVLGLLLISIVLLEHRSFRKVSVGIIIIGGFVIAVMLFRIFYYGSPIPNSVIAKSVSIFPLETFFRCLYHGFCYVTKFAFTNLYLMILLFGALFFLFKKYTLHNKSSYILLFCVGGIIFSFIVVIRNGGDWMPNYRLLIQYGPLYAVLLILLMRHNFVKISIALLLVTCPLIHTARNIYKTRSIFSFSIQYRKVDDFWVDTTRRLSTVLTDSDTVSAEAIGYISYHLIDTWFHDPIGLLDPYLAKHGQPSRTYGKHDIAYSIGEVQPSVMVWHHAEHLKGVDQNLLDNYETFCACDCDNWRADIVMIRRDRVEDLAPAFSDLEKIKIESDWIGPK